MDIRQQAIGPVLAVIDSLRSTANMLEAQVQALAPQNSQMGPPMSMFQMYSPSHSIPIAPQLQSQHQQQQQHAHPHQQHAHQHAGSGPGGLAPPPNSGGSAPGGTTGVIRKRELLDSANANNGAGGAAGYDDAGAPVKKRRRRRKRNADGVLVERDDVYENGDGVLHPVGRGRGRGSRGGGAGGLRGAGHNQDPNRPKRPASAYLLFQNEVRKDMQATYPELPYHEILGKISERWAALSEQEKKHYTDITIVQKLQYEKDKAKWEAEKSSMALGGAPPPSAASSTAAPGTNATVLIGRPDGQISTGLVPVASLSGAEEGDDDDDDEEASEASAAIEQDDEEEEDEEDEGGGEE